MKNTGVVRRLDELGRITLPMELRKVFGIEERDSLEIYVEDDNYADPYNVGSGYVLFIQAILNRKYPQQYTCFNRGHNGDRISDLYARERIDGICTRTVCHPFPGR